MVAVSSFLLTVQSEIIYQNQMWVSRFKFRQFLVRFVFGLLNTRPNPQILILERSFVNQKTKALPIFADQSSLSQRLPFLNMSTNSPL